jgi:hypothetical protein
VAALENGSELERMAHSIPAGVGRAGTRLRTKTVRAFHFDVADEACLGRPRACDSEVIRARLSSYRWLSVWRRVAVDHLESSLAELLALTHVAGADLGSVGTPVDEALCERMLGDVDVLIERCREFGGDEDLSREALDAEAGAFADEVAGRFTLSRDSGETAE